MTAVDHTGIVLSHAHPKGHEFVVKVGDSTWSQVYNLLWLV